VAGGQGEGVCVCVFRGGGGCQRAPPGPMNAHRALGWTPPVDVHAGLADLWNGKTAHAHPGENLRAPSGVAAPLTARVSHKLQPQASFSPWPWLARTACTDQ
jgi:hypothetical protein